MKIRNLLPFGFVAGLITLSGCTTVNSVENANKVGQRNMITDSRVITDEDLNREVSIVGVNTSTTPGGLLRVQVEVQNRTRSQQRFLYHFEWFDANGMQVNNVLSTSIPEQIEGEEDKFISGIAPTPDCKDFRVKFIEAN
ncbi:MAG TPA: YcfL family protein [Verrucomicrobiae bacterium]|jgi:uncharacterized protein YcfL